MSLKKTVKAGKALPKAIEKKKESVHDEIEKSVKPSSVHVKIQTAEGRKRAMKKAHAKK